MRHPNECRRCRDMVSAHDKVGIAATLVRGIVYLAIAIGIVWVNDLIG